MEQIQIQQHEWEIKYKWFHRCPHCECVMIVPSLGTNAYIPKGHPHDSKSLSEEPACITRTINAPQREADK